MAPSLTSQPIHPGVLPQPQALESASADNHRGTDETGRGRSADSRATSGRHGRGEIVEEGTHTRRRHPGSAAADSGASGLTAHPYVFVLDKHDRPLQPCHPARARRLLAVKRAVVVRHTPFVIRLKDRTLEDSVVPGVELGIDPGSKRTGIAMFTTQMIEQHDPPNKKIGLSRRGVFAIELRHRGSWIHEQLIQRAAYRRRRRSRNLRYRKPRFSNRGRPEGWLPPSLQHRVITARSWVDRLRRWAPVRAVHVERVAFDTQLLQHPGIAGVEYQQGTLAGAEVREYLLAKWGRRCAYCGVSGVPLNLDHVQPRSRGGSDRVSNLTLACVPCNQAKGNRPVKEFLADRPHQLSRIMAQTKRPLRDAAVVNAIRQALLLNLDVTGLDVHSATGGQTKWNRSRCSLPKSHTLDALCVGQLDAVVRMPDVVLTVTATGRGGYKRTTPDRYGFPRLQLPRVKQVRGFMTGDLACAIVPKGKNAGTHVGRVAVRTNGNFSIRTRTVIIQSVNHRRCRLLQRADGYGYTWEEESAVVPS